MKIYYSKYTSLFSVLWLVALSGSIGFSKPTLDAEGADQLALQLFLDSENFGPGRVDGKWGEFTGKALQRWNEANSSRTVEMVDGSPASGSGIKLWGDGKSVITEYTFTERDLEMIGDLPGEPEGKASLKFLPYASALEFISEKFHADHDFIRGLNSGIEWEALSAGDVIIVPNVASPFELGTVEGAAKLIGGNGKDLSGGIEKTRPPESDEGKGKVSAEVLLTREIVEVREGETLIGTFPISVGAQGNETPPGDWEVDVVQWMPEFRYDEQMLKQGKRSDDFLMLPPGPNSPVGIVWIGLNADGIGLHGTDNAHDIGRNESSGCIRLSNWDARTLGMLLEVGASVKVTE